MPYNYLIDSKIRENLDINYANSVIIIDEAHNIAQCCEDISSFEVKSGNLDKVLIEIQSLKDHIAHDNESKEFRTSEESLQIIKLMTERFNKFL